MVRTRQTSNAAPLVNTKDLKLINLLKGWPNPSLLPTAAIAQAAQTVLQDPSISVPALCYGPDPGYQPLREEISKWLSDFYGDDDPTSQQQHGQSTQNALSDSKPVETSATGQAPPESSEGGDRICITGGASQNLACVLQVFSDPVKTKRVWMVAPCYFLACRIFEDGGLRLSAVAEGEDGIDLVGLEKAILQVEKEETGNEAAIKPQTPYGKFYSHIIYLVPTFSNPSGKTMSSSKRKQLVQLARKYDALIITDDVYDFLQWRAAPNSSSTSATPKAPVPRLIDIDRTLHPTPPVDSFGNALSNGSFSKIVGPGVRTGWAEAAPKLIYGLSQCGSSRSGGAPSQLVATMMCELLKSGSLQAHIKETLVPVFAKSYAIMLAAIKKHLLPLGVTIADVNFGEKWEEQVAGGYFVFLTLPPNVEAREVTNRAREEWNLIVSPGEVFEVRGDDNIKLGGQIRLCFAWEEAEDLAEGVERLARVVESFGEGKVRVEAKGGKEGEKMDLGEFQ